MDLSKQFRKAASEENQGRNRSGWRYSAELKSLAVAHVRHRREEGAPWSTISEDLGVTTLTLGRWLETVSPVTTKFHPVEVISDAQIQAQTEHSIAVLTPGGLRIEGLSWPEALEFAKEFR